MSMVRPREIHPVVRRRQWRTAALAAGVLVLCSCSPDDVTGIGITDDGTPVVTNCGAWIEGVTVSDFDSGRVLWTAAIGQSRDRSDGRHDVGDVLVGLVPDEAWIETAPFAPEPRPTTWAFSVATGMNVPTKIVVADSDLAPANVYVDAETRVSKREFVDDVCGYASPSTARQVAVGAAFVAAAAAAAGWFLRRRRESSTPGAAGRRVPSA